MLENDGPRTQMHADRHRNLANRNLDSLSEPVRNRFESDILDQIIEAVSVRPTLRGTM